MNSVLLNVAVIGVSLAPVAFALVCGRKAERLGAVVIGSGQVLTWGAQSAFQASAAQVPLTAFMAIDLSLALALGLIAFRYPDKLWPDLAACAQLLVFVFSVTRAIDFPLSPTAFIVAVNASSFMALVALCFGTWAARWCREPISEWDCAGPNLQPLGGQ